MALLWNATTGRVGLLPGIVPKVAALGVLTIAGASARLGALPVALQIATFVAAACLLASFATPWAALPGLLVAAVGTLVSFSAYVNGSISAGWVFSAVMVAYGMAIISTLMVLVEREGMLCESS
jgi:hypothetical protein